MEKQDIFSFPIAIIRKSCFSMMSYDTTLLYFGSIMCKKETAIEQKHSSFKMYSVKTFLLLIIIHLAILSSPKAQVPAGAIPAAEMKKMTEELKKEIEALKADIKNAEKEDPESVPAMKAQLQTYNTMLAAFGQQKPSSTQSSPAPAKAKALTQTPSPIAAAHIKQPIAIPTAAQAQHRFFWYKGKKINDSTLVTAKGTIIQYSAKKQQLIVQPDEKKDSFTTRVKEIMRGEQRKRELLDQFDKMKNGFIYYPFITTSIALYDDLTARYVKAVNNTITFDKPAPSFSLRSKSSQSILPGKGPNTSMENDEDANMQEGELEWVLQQLDEAQKKYNQLPPVDNFPAPPLRELGRCATCDPALIHRQRERDEKWMEEYKAKEAAILQQVLSAMQAHTFIPGQPSADLVNEKFHTLLNSLMKRITEKNRILLDRYGSNLQYLSGIFPVILGHERQKELLGVNDLSTGDPLPQIISKAENAYWKYYNEQVEAKNHDFVLNIPFHLGYFRQLALLGNNDPQAGTVNDFLNRMVAYNRFALTMELDFIWERTAEDELQLRATGKMGTKEKAFVMLYPDNCRFRMMAYTTDLSNKTLEDITVPFQVFNGNKTVREQNDQLVNYPYKGPAEYALRLPDARIEFCSNVSDTLFLSPIGGNEDVKARAEMDMQNIARSYTVDILNYANQVLLNEDADEMTNQTQQAGTNMLANIAGFMQAGAPASVSEKLKTQYDGYMNMDNLRRDLESAAATGQSYILFNANNRATVLADTYHDTHRKMTDDVEVKKGLYHVRLVHEPMK